MRNQWWQRVNCVSQQPDSHTSVIQLLRNRALNLWIYPPVHVNSLVLDKNIFPFRWSLWKWLNRNITYSFILCRSRSGRWWVMELVDAWQKSLHMRIYKLIWMYRSGKSHIWWICTTHVVSSVCESACRPHWYVITERRGRATQGRGGGGMDVPELLIAWVLGVETITRVWLSKELN